MSLLPEEENLLLFPVVSFSGTFLDDPIHQEFIDHSINVNTFLRMNLIYVLFFQAVKNIPVIFQMVNLLILFHLSSLIRFIKMNYSFRMRAMLLISASTLNHR